MRREPPEAGIRRGGDILVLGYHAVSDSWPSDLAVRSDELERQLTGLVRRGYQGATFTHAVTRPPGARTLVVTFDDAYRSVMALAFPILDKLSLPGTVFVPTDLAAGGLRASWPGVDIHLRTPHAHELEVMGWEDLRGLVAAGWEIGSHTCSHPMLTKISDSELARELRESREQCERHLGVSCQSIAYPYGDTDERVIAAAGQTGYAAAAGLPPASALHREQALNWPRIGIFLGDGRGRFNIKVSRTIRRVRMLIGRGS